MTTSNDCASMIQCVPVIAIDRPEEPPKPRQPVNVVNTKPEISYVNLRTLRPTDVFVRILHRSVEHYEYMLMTVTHISCQSHVVPIGQYYYLAN